MRVFLDTNIFLEYFQRRTYHKEVSRIFDAIEDGNIKAYVSAGTIYTLAYLIRMELKRMQIHRPEQTSRLRTALNTILSLVSVGNVSHKTFSKVQMIMVLMISRTVSNISVPCRTNVM